MINRDLKSRYAKAHLLNQSLQKVHSMKALISVSCISLLALSVTACASGTAPASTPTALTMDHCKAHVAQFVPTQNKNDAALQMDLACANLVKK
jgi:hypothetical protein